jgi:hypothetical protein
MSDLGKATDGTGEAEPTHSEVKRTGMKVFKVIILLAAIREKDPDPFPSCRCAKAHTVLCWRVTLRNLAGSKRVSPSRFLILGESISPNLLFGPRTVD